MGPIRLGCSLVIVVIKVDCVRSGKKSFFFFGLSKIQGHYFIRQLPVTTSFGVVYRINLRHLPDRPHVGRSDYSYRLQLSNKIRTQMLTFGIPLWIVNIVNKDLYLGKA